MADYVFSGNNKTALRLTVSQGAQSIDGNYTDVNWWAGYVQVSGTGASWQLYHSIAASVVIDGTTVWSASNLDMDTRGLAAGNAPGFASGTKRIYHNADGTKTVACSASCSDPQGVFGSASGSLSLALTTIPRATTPTLSKTSQDINGSDSVTVNLPRASSSFTHDVSVAVAGTVVASATGQATSWAYTIPAARVALLPDTTSAAAVVTVTTKSGSAVIGVKTISLTVNVPTTIVPAGTLAAARVDNAVPTAWAVYVQGYSGVTLNLTSPAPGTGATLKTWTISGPDGSASGTYDGAAAKSLAVSRLPTSGAQTYTAVITDSRGRTTTKTVSITVQPYSPPVITNPTAVRCDSAGTASETGTYAKTQATVSISSVSSKNTSTNTVAYRKSGATAFGTETAFTSGAAKTIGANDMAVDYPWEIRWTVKDGLTTTTQVITTVGPTFYYQSFDANSGAVALGGPAETTKRLRVYNTLPVQIDGVATFAQTIAGSVNGSAAKLTTARTIALAGAVTGSAAFDGSANASITAALGTAAHAFTYNSAYALYNADYAVPRVVAIGAMRIFEGGMVKNNAAQSVAASTYVVVGTIPAAVAPPKNRIVPCLVQTSGGYVMAALRITTAGEVAWVYINGALTIAANSYIALPTIIWVA
ncbi:MAG: DUF859 domain-containing protein [Propionibacteriaceae bacterium]|jgi:hypothetical protein|nr:DUF859 domain-containing protein [Propionibacteriaceae bacterium]